MLKKIITLIMLAVTPAWALSETLLVLDARNTDNLPKKFRIDEPLHAAGSAQFSERGLLKVMDRLSGKKVTIVDLRQESHGYLNGNAISWYGEHDAANADLSPQAIMKRESDLLKSLARNKFAKVYNIIDKSQDGVITSAKPQEYVVHGASTEQELTEKHHLGYKRFYVQDFHAPDAKAVEDFVQFIKTLPDDEWLYFHCRGGSGRTTSFMAMYDMIRHASTKSFDEMIEGQAKLGGKELRKLPDDNDYKYKPALERLAFLKKFYEYAKENNFDISWSVWLKQHS